LPTSRDGPTEAGHLLATVEKWDGERGLDILDYAFGHITGRSASFTNPQDHAAILADLLTRGGSAWEVVPAPDGANYMLARRALGPVADAITQIAEDPNERVHI
jgi:hypothetical protein